MNSDHLKKKTPENWHGEVRRLVSAIPEGRVVTYGGIAALIPGVTPRMAGYALAALPENSCLPWHRVVNRLGEISLRKNGDGADVQKALLEDEGVVFNRNSRIDLSVYGWDRELGLPADE